MSFGGRGKGLHGPSNGMDEVDEVLRAAEDELLLNLTRNTHTTVHPLQAPHLPLPTPSSTPLDSDLARRFEALKASRVPRHAPTTPTGDKSAAPPADGSADDLMARFAALKGSDDRSTGRTDGSPEMAVARNRRTAEEEGGDGGVPMGEVEKIMQWAMDEVRLDRSSPSGKGGGAMAREDADDESKGSSRDTSEEDDDDDVEDEDEAERKRKEKKNGKGKGERRKKWFYF